MNNARYFWTYYHNICISWHIACNRWSWINQLILAEITAIHLKHILKLVFLLYVDLLWDFFKTLNSFAKSSVLTLIEYWALHNHLLSDMFKTYLATLLLYPSSYFLPLNFLMNFSSLEAQAGWAPALNFMEDLLKQVLVCVWSDG